MGVCIVLTPIIIAGWPAFSAAVVAAASSLGYQVASSAARQTKAAAGPQKLQLEIERSEVVTDKLARDQHISVNNEGISVTFSRDARGKATLCVSGHGMAEEELRAKGEELSRAVVQQYVLQKLQDEMRARGFVVVEQETTEDRAIHMKVRHWSQ